MAKLTQKQRDHLQFIRHELQAHMELVMEAYENSDSVKTRGDLSVLHNGLASTLRRV